MAVRIGSARIADGLGTHEPGEVIDSPSQALLELATAGTLDPETSLAYCEIVPVDVPQASKASTPPPAPPAAVPDPEKPV